MSANYRNPNWLLPNEKNLKQPASGTVTGSGLAEDRKSLYSMNFDGSDYIPIELSPAGGNRTVSLWFKSDNISTTRGFMAFAARGDGYNGQITIGQYNSKIVASIVTSWPTTVNYETSTLSSDTWYNIVVVLNDLVATIYVNGTPDTTTPAEAGFGFGDIVSYIGKSKIANTGLVGSIDEVATWNKSLSATEVAALSTAGAPANLMALSHVPYSYYPLGEFAGNSGEKGGTPSGQTNSWKFPNQVLKDYVFDFENSGAPAVGQTGDNIQLGSTINLGTQNTISFWFKAPPPSPVTNDRFCMIGNQYTSSKYTIFIFDNQILYRVGNNAGGSLSWTLTGGGAPLLDDKWHNIILNRSGASASLYIDGVDKGSPAGTIVATDDTFMDTIGSTSPLTISYYYNGEMSNVVAWNSDQTSEKDNIYNNGSPATSYTNTPTAWWKLNAANSSYDAATSTWNFTDSTRATSPTYTSAIQTTVATNKISTGNVTAPSMAHTYFSFWFKSSDSSEKQVVLNNLGGLVIGPTRAYIKTHHSAIYKRFSISTLTDGSWHNIIYGFPNEGGSVSLNDMKLWVDGQELIGGNIGGATMTGNVSQVQGLYYGGASGSLSAHVPSSLSNYAFFNTDVSGQVSTIWNNGTPGDISTLNPYIWYKLENITSGLNDSGSGGNNGSLTGTFNNETTNVLAPSVNATSTTLSSTSLIPSDLQFESPYSNFSLDFDGTGNYLDLTQHDLGTTNTISLWLNISSITADQTVLGEPSNTYKQSVVIGSNIIYIKDVSNHYKGWNLSTSSEFSINNWHHFGIVRSGSTVTFYIDGIDQGSPDSSSGAFTANTKLRYLGTNYATNTQFVDGKIDEIALWSSALTASQINQVYNNGRPGNLTSLSPTNWWRLGEDAYFVNNNITIPNQISGGPTGTGSGTQTAMLSADAPQSYGGGYGVGLTVRDKIGDAPNSTANSISYNMIPDNRHPYAPGYVPAQVDNAFSMNFDAASDNYMLVPGSAFSASASDFSISFWYFRSSNPSGHETVIYKANNFEIYQHSNGQAFWTYFGGVSSNTNKIPIVLNGWKHVCYVVTSTGFKGYQNGSLVAENTFSSTPNYGGASNSMYFGGQQSVKHSNMKLDEIAFFDYALTAKQIKEDIYNASTTGKTADLSNNSNLTAPVAWYRMGD